MSIGSNLARAPDPLAPVAGNLAALRLIATICVVVSNCAVLREGGAPAKPLAALGTFSLGDHALHALFFMGGLMIAAGLATSRSLADFIVARALRVWPTALAVTVIMALVVAPVFSTVSPEAYFANTAWTTMIGKSLILLGSTQGLPGLFAGNPLPNIVNGMIGPLGCGALCLAIFVAGSFATVRLGAFWRSTWLPMLTLMAGAWMVIPPGSDRGSTAPFFVAFGLGALASQWRRRLPSPWLLFALAAAGLWVATGGRWEAFAAIVLVGAFTLLLAVEPLGSAGRIFGEHDLSLGLYLTSWPVTQMLLANAPMSTALLSGLVLAISGTLAFMSWTLIEKPAMRLRRRLAASLERTFAQSRLGKIAFAGSPNRR